jgi:Ca2+-binding RTX toxin-like protein
VFIRDGVVAINDGGGGAATFTMGFNPNAANNGRYYLNQLNSSIVNFTHSAQASARLPVYYPLQTSQLNPDITFNTTDLFNMSSANTTLSAPNFDVEMDSIDLLQDLGVLIDGLDLVLAGTQDVLANEVLGQVFPLVGDQLSGAVDVIGDFREGTLAELRTQFAGSKTSAAVQVALFNALGPTGLNLLDPNYHDAGGDAVRDTQADLDDVVVTVVDDGNGKTTELQFNMRLINDFYTAQLPVGFDLGLPGLGLAIDPNSAVQLDLGYQYEFGFGVSLTDGVYIDTAAANDLIIDLNATIPNFVGTASLGFLQLDVRDRQTAPSHFTGQFAIDLMDPVGTNNRLTFNEIAAGNLNFASMIDASLSAQADVNLDLIASIGGNMQFPSVLADFDMDWVFDPAQGLRGDKPTVAFGNVRMDLGEFFSNFVDPILTNIQSTLAPLEPVIEVLTEPLPLISDFFGPTSLLDLARIFGYDQTADFIQAADQILDLIDGFSTVGGNVYYDLGGFDLNLPTLDLRDSQSTLTLTDITSRITPPTAAPPTDLADFTQRTRNITAGGLAFPIIDNPATVFGLFLGKEADFFTYTMPTFTAQFDYRAYFGPVWPVPPIMLTLAGGVGLEANFTFGYDTYGIRSYLETDNPTDLFDGFYIADLPIPEVDMWGYIAGGAAVGIDLGIIGGAIGVEGGLFAEIEFDLADPNDDGKLRGFELMQNLGHGLMCVFDTHGQLDFRLRAFYEFKVDIGIASYTKRDYYPIVSQTLASFDHDCDVEPPVLAELDPDTGALTLNVGDRAALRQTVNTTDGDEVYTIKRLSDDAVMVEAFGFIQIYGGYNPDLDRTITVSKIVGDAGLGNDQILIDDGVRVTAELSGGAGNDILQGGSGHDLLQGGAGLDTLLGQSGDDQLYGHMLSGTDDDLAADRLEGGAGADMLDGGLGDDALLGGLGNDTLYGRGGLDLLFGNEGNDILYGGEDADILSGDAGDDLIYGGLGDDVLDGGAGRDRLEGNDGADLLVGGSSRDWLYGHSEAGTGDDNASDILYGDLGVGSGLFSQSFGEAMGDDFLYGQGGDDILYGEEGHDQLYGALGDDELHGQQGDDLLYGEAGADRLYGESGSDQLIGGTGDDLLYGGSEDDALHGGLGDDVLWGGEGNDALRRQ